MSIDPVVLDDTKLLQQLMDLAYWGPRGPDAGNDPSAPTFSALDATVRIGAIVGTLLARGFKPTWPKPGITR